MLLELFHGSEKIISRPKYGKGKPFNDYGKAFYTTKEIDLAREWAVEKDRDGYVNCYELELDGLKVLNLCDDQYTIMNWLSLLVDNRTFEIQTDFGLEAINYLRENFLLPYDEYDVIIGYRADDSYFSFAQDFLNNTISISTLSKAMYLGDLGKQVAIKSERAFERIKFLGSEDVKAIEWYPQKEYRDNAARSRYAQMRNEPWKRGEIYMMTIIDEEIKPDDMRLRPGIT